MQAQGFEVINLGIGDPDLQPHPSIIQALDEAAASLQANRYQPYRDTQALREAFSAWMQRFFAVPLDLETEILPLMGSKEGIVLISLAYVNPGDQVLLSNPGYPAYGTASQIAGGEAVHYDLKAERG